MMLKNISIETSKSTLSPLMSANAPELWVFYQEVSYMFGSCDFRFFVLPRKVNFRLDTKYKVRDNCPYWNMTPLISETGHPLWRLYADLTESIPLDILLTDDRLIGKDT